MSLINLNHLPEKQIIEGFNVRFVHSENMTIAYWNIEAGAFLPEHSHHHEQICSVIEGELELMVEGKSNLMKAGYVFTIPPNAIHSGKAITKCRVIDTFYPVREDYK